MTDAPAAFKATYADMKFVKTRGMVQFVFEVPISKSNEALEVLGGLPKPAAEMWCAIAVLDLKAESEVVSEPAQTLESSRPSSSPIARATPSKQPENKACQRLGILCNEPAFRKFLEDRRISPLFVNSAESAASAVRDYFGVKSRTEVYEDNPKYVALMADYRAWFQRPSVVPA